MMTLDSAPLATLVLLGALLVLAFAGCGARDAAVQPPPGMKMAQPLTDAQIQALEQKKQARGQQQAPVTQ